MAMRIACLAVGLLIVASKIATSQEENTRNPNSRLRRSGTPSGSLREPKEPPTAGGGVSVSASAGAMSFGWGRGRGVAMGSNGYGPTGGYGGPNRNMAWSNGGGGGVARSQSSITIRQGGQPVPTSPSRTAARSNATSSKKAGEKSTRTATLVEEDRTITVVESKNRVKVTLTDEATGEEKSYAAKNAKELEKKFPEAFDAYQRAMGESEEDLLEGDVESRAERELKQRFDEMEQQSGDNPAMQQMLQQMRRDLDR